MVSDASSSSEFWINLSSSSVFVPAKWPSIDGLRFLGFGASSESSLLSWSASSLSSLSFSISITSMGGVGGALVGAGVRAIFGCVFGCVVMGRSLCEVVTCLFVEFGEVRLGGFFILCACFFAWIGFLCVFLAGGVYLSYLCMWVW